MLTVPGIIQMAMFPFEKLGVLHQLTTVPSGDTWPTCPLSATSLVGLDQLLFYPNSIALCFIPELPVLQYITHKWNYLVTSV